MSKYRIVKVDSRNHPYPHHEFPFVYEVHELMHKKFLGFTLSATEWVHVDWHFSLKSAQYDIEKRIAAARPPIDSVVVWEGP